MAVLHRPCMLGDADFSGDGHQLPWVAEARAEFRFQEKKVGAIPTGSRSGPAIRIVYQRDFAAAAANHVFFRAKLDGQPANVSPRGPVNRPVLNHHKREHR